MSNKKKYPKDLLGFVSLLEEANELTRIECEVDSHLELAAIVDRVCKTFEDRPALLFTKVLERALPVAANLFGSRKRMALCLGSDDLSLLSRKLMKDLKATHLPKSKDALTKVVDASRGAAVVVDDAAWKCNLLESDWLRLVPVPKFWPNDGGRYITLGQVYTSHPTTGQVNCGLYRIQAVDSDRALLRCHPGSGGLEHLNAWHALDEPMPVAISLGGPPAMVWAASASLPKNISEVDFLSYLTGDGVPMSRCLHSGMLVPSTADIVIEGRIYPQDVLPEGPFGNHTGYYAPQSPAPVIRIDSVSMKDDAIYPCTVVGPPPMENIALAKVTAGIFKCLLQYDNPWVQNVYMPEMTIFHRAAMVSVDNKCDLVPEDIAERLLESLLLKGSKLMILLDDDVDVKDLTGIYWHVVNKLKCKKQSECIVVDSRSRQGSERVSQAEHILKKVSLRWDEYDI